MKYLKFKIFLCILLLLFLNTKSAKSMQDKLVAIVNNEIITESDVKEFLSVFRLQLSSQLEGEELQKEMKKAEEGVVERLVEDKLIIQEAKKQGLQADNELIEGKLQQIKGNFRSDEEFSLYLKMNKLTPAEIKTKIAEQILMHDIVEQEVRSKIFVHPQEVTDYYLAHLGELQEPEKLDLESIFIRIDGSEQEAADKVKEILDLLTKGEDFFALEEKFSQSPSLGLVKKGQLNEEIEAIVFKLKEGEISSPIKTNNGFYLFKIKNIIPAGEIKLEEVRDQIYQALFNQKFQERFIEWIDGIKETAYILIK